MLAFRKWFLVLALVTLTAAVASAQPAFQCTANAGVPPIVRAEGIAELVGDLVLNCTGGAPAANAASVPRVNVQIFLNTNITSKLLSSADNFSEALLMVDDPQPAEQKVCLANAAVIGCDAPTPKTVIPDPTAPAGEYKPANGNPYNVWQGRQALDNSIAWYGVPIDAPGTAVTRVIRMTNIRANANLLGVSSTLVPTQIVAFVSASGATSVPINNPQQTVAWIQTGLTFTVRKFNGDSGSVTLNQCNSSNKDLFTDPTKTDKYCATGRLRFEEGFATAWKTMPTGDQNIPGKIYSYSEGGFMATSIGNPLPAGAGVPSQGTRLRVAFNSVPAGLRIYVTTGGQRVDSTDTTANSWVLINTAQDGSGGSASTVVPDTFMTKKCDFASQVKMAEVPIFGGSGVAVWEATATEPLAVQKIEFGYLVAYAANTPNNLPAIGSATANGMFAPISTVTKASYFAPVPRFADTSSAKTVFKVQQCATNLLFPFVSNQAGFDTGMVIANTSKDPWDHDLETGTCEIS